VNTAQAVYFFAAALALALLEIQIEGPNGWAASLPTWRWKPAFLHRPVTGYHVYLLAFILLGVHLPQLYMGFSWAREAELMSLFFLLAVVWDFLWFALNPHFGLARFRPSCVWWFGRWICGVPADYLVGLAVSLLVYLAPAGDLDALGARAGAWARTLGVFAGLTLVSLLGRLRLSSRAGRPRAGDVGAPKA
jgi:hypothetical protein